MRSERPGSDGRDVPARPDRMTRDARLDELLAGVARDERARPSPDPEAFLVRLRRRRLHRTRASTPGTDRSEAGAAASRSRRWLLRAAGLLLLLALPAGIWRLASRDDENPAEAALLAHLDVLQAIEVLEPAELEQLDLETVELIEDWELLRELPIEILETDPENS